MALIGFLAVRGSPYVAELPWIPRWLAIWADAHGVWRNVPAFGALYLVVLVGLGWNRRVIALAAVCVFAACVEFAQLLLPAGRRGSGRVLLYFSGFPMWRNRMGDCWIAHTERFRGRRPTVGHVCADVDVGAPGAAPGFRAARFISCNR